MKQDDVLSAMRDEPRKTTKVVLLLLALHVKVARWFMVRKKKKFSRVMVVGNVKGDGIDVR